MLKFQQIMISVFCMLSFGVTGVGCYLVYIFGINLHYLLINPTTEIAIELGNNPKISITTGVTGLVLVFMSFFFLWFTYKRFDKITDLIGEKETKKELELNAI